MREILRRQRKLKFRDEDNFRIFTQDTLTSLYQQLTGGIYVVMIAISSIGLVVGGVGVMNIMLVSVTERTREIGVRKALGARRRDILWQFLTEAMTLTAVGGVLGILIGGLVASLVDWLSPFPAVLQPAWITIAFVTSVGVGLTFGLWPGRRHASIPSRPGYSESGDDQPSGFAASRGLTSPAIVQSSRVRRAFSGAALATSSWARRSRSLGIHRPRSSRSPYRDSPSCDHVRRTAPKSSRHALLRSWPCWASPFRRWAGAVGGSSFGLRSSTGVAVSLQANRSRGELDVCCPLAVGPCPHASRLH